VPIKDNYVIDTQWAQVAQLSGRNFIEISF